MNDKIKLKDFFIYAFIYICILWIVILIALKSQYSLSSFYFRLNSDKINDEIVVVAIDKKTLNSDRFKRFQDLDRPIYAELLNKITYWDPKIIWVDVFFLHDSSDSSQDVQLRKILEANDNIIIAWETQWWKLADWVFMGNDYKNYWYVDTVSLNDVDIFWFHFNDYKNKIPIVANWENPILPLSVEVFKRYYWYDNVNVDFDSSSIFFDNKYKVKLQDSWDKYLNINYFTNDFKVVSFIDVIQGFVDVGVFKDKIVLVWATASEIHDEFLTPYDTSNFMPWIFIHANTINTLSEDKNLIYQWFWGFLITNAIIIFIIMLALISIKSSYIGILISLWTFAVFSIWSVVLYYFLWFFIEVFPTLVWFSVLSLIIFLMKYFEENKNKKQIQSMFSRYVSKDVVDQIVWLWIDTLSLWWIEKKVTVFFSDLVWFTDLSEKLNAEQLGTILNIYFENMSNIILSSRWTIDKFMWDAIMAFWNAPFDILWHESLACEAALLQRQALYWIKNEIKKFWVTSPIDMRIWINTWNVVVWNFWCSKRYDYTVLWDTVNLGSRLESINKQYETKIMLSEYTYENIDKDKFVIREIDLITVKWKVQPVRIYELVWFNWIVDDHILNNIRTFSEWLSYYRDRNFIKAMELFGSINDWPSRVFLSRCQEFLKQPPEANWDNVFRFKVK